MKNMGVICWISFILVIIGALNWGLVGIFGFNLVAAIFGASTVVTKVIYILVGLGGLWMIYKLCNCKGSSNC